MKNIIMIFLYLFLNLVMVLFLSNHFGSSSMIIALYIFIVIAFVILNEKLKIILEKIDNLEKESNDYKDENEEIEKNI